MIFLFAILFFPPPAQTTAKTKQTGKMSEETLRDFYALCVMFFWDIMLRKCNGCRFGYLLPAGVFSLLYSPKKTHRAVGGEPIARWKAIHTAQKQSCFSCILLFFFVQYLQVPAFVLSLAQSIFSLKSGSLPCLLSDDSIWKFMLLFQSRAGVSG